MGRMKEQYTIAQNIMVDLKSFMGEKQFNTLYYFMKVSLEESVREGSEEHEVAKAFKEMMETIE